MTTTPPQEPGDGTAPPSADVTEYCLRGQHYKCHGTVLIWPPDETGNAYKPCACPVPDCGHGRRDRLKR